MIVFSHRGYSSKYPENTMLAFEKAIEIGSNGIELDVHKSKDNKIVIIHDEDIKRTFNGSGNVSDFTLKELKEFKSLEEMFSNNIKCRIPTLDEVMKLLQDKEGITLNIELKTDVIEYDEIERDVIELVKKYKMENRIILSSFNHESIRRCKEINPNIKTGMLYHYKVSNPISMAKEIKADALHPNANLVTKELIEECHRNNLKVNSYTVNSQDIMKKFKEWNIDGMFTDYPKDLIEVLDGNI